MTEFEQKLRAAVALFVDGIANADQAEHVTTLAAIRQEGLEINEAVDRARARRDDLQQKRAALRRKGPDPDAAADAFLSETTSDIETEESISTEIDRLNAVVSGLNRRADQTRQRQCEAEQAVGRDLRDATMSGREALNALLVEHLNQLDQWQAVAAVLMDAAVSSNFITEPLRTFLGRVQFLGDISVAPAEPRPAWVMNILEPLRPKIELARGRLPSNAKPAVSREAEEPKAAEPYKNRSWLSPKWAGSQPSTTFPI